MPEVHYNSACFFKNILSNENYLQYEGQRAEMGKIEQMFFRFWPSGMDLCD